MVHTSQVNYFKLWEGHHYVGHRPFFSELYLPVNLSRHVLRAYLVQPHICQSLLYGSWIHSLFFEPIYIYAASTSSTFGLLLRSRTQLPITWCCSSSLHALRLVLGFVRGLVFWHRPKRQYSTRLVLVEYRASGVFNINNRLASSGSGASPASRTHYIVH